MNPEESLVAIRAVVTIFAAVAIGAFLGGTIIYYIWPIAIPAVFPKLVEEGILASSLTWWQSICLT